MLLRGVRRLVRMMRVVRLTPYETTTDTGRSQERYRRAALSALTAAVARASTIAAALISVPLCINHLGNERYGMWLALSSLFAFAYVADLGVTAGLQLAIARCHARDDAANARRYVSTAFAILGATTILGLGLLLLLYVYVDWAALFNVRDPVAVTEAGQAAVMFGAVWMINILVAVVLRVSYGYQEGHYAHLWQILGSWLSVVAVAGAVHAGLGLPSLVFALAGMPAVAGAIHGIQLFVYRRPELRPSLREIDRRFARQLLGDGGWYLLAGLSYNAVFLASNMIIAQLLGAAIVPEFGVPFRAASVITLVLAIIATAVQPAYTEAIGRGDLAWVGRMVRRSVALVFLLAAGGSLGLVLLGPRVIDLWVGGAVRPDHASLAGFAVWTLISGTATALNAFVQGSGGVRANGIQWLTAAVLAVPTQFASIQLLGVYGIAWGIAALELSCRLVPSIFYYRRWCREHGAHR